MIGLAVVVVVSSPPFTQSAFTIPPAWTMPSNDLELTIKPKHACCTSSAVSFSACLQAREHEKLKSLVTHVGISVL